MHRRLLFGAAMSLCFTLPVAAQPGPNALWDRLTSVDSRNTTFSDCQSQLAKARQLNAPDLLYGAAVCYAAERAVEGNFLLNAGQVRALTDLQLLAPASKSDSDVAAALYGVLYYRAGGPGDEEVLRRPTSRDRFFTLFDEWSPEYGADYDPGWRHLRKPDEVAYRAAMQEAKTARRTQLVNTARLASDATYASLNRRLQELTRRNPNGFIEGTPDAETSRELLGRMRKRAAALGVGASEEPPSDMDKPAAKDRFPPAAPAADEATASNSGPVAQHCADLAERMTIARESRIVEVLVTQHPKWGIIWRADVARDDHPTERFTCTANTTSSRPLEMGPNRISPLSK